MGTICLRTLVEANKNIAAILAPPKDSASYQYFLDEIKRYDTPILNYDKSLKEEALLEQIRQIKPDVAVVCSFSKKIPKEMLELVPGGFINCHPSLLPDYRGGNPYFYIINNGEKKSGVTLHYMDEEFDTGDIIVQQSFFVDEFETMGTLFNKTNFMTAEMLVALIDNLENNKPVNRTPQDRTGSYKKAPMVDFEKGENKIDWNQTAQQIERFIRACNPFWGVFSYFRGCYIKFYSASYESKKHNYEPGTIVKVRKDQIAIAAKEGILYPQMLHVGSYFCGGVSDFVRFSHPLVGEKFE